MADTKKANAVTLVTSPTINSNFLMTDASTGAMQRITGENLKSYVKDGTNYFHMYNNISILTTDGRMVSLEYWKSNPTAFTAVGVVVCEGDKHLVVALDEAPEKLAFASAYSTYGGVSAGSRKEAIKDWSGEENTKAQIQHAECNGATYAPGYCAAYSKVSDSGAGIAAGKWWLPSAGELNMIKCNVDRINYALSLIDGATQITKETHWSSTENGTYNAWGQSFIAYNGYLSNYNKVDRKFLVRPVSAYQ
jgi:hypothetical protein